MTIPIIILNWNGLDDTIECLNALWLQTHQDFIIYLVDNGSQIDNVKYLQTHYSNHPKIQLILNKENLGFTKGNNEILKQLLSENYLYIALLNNDTSVDQYWLENLVNSAQKNQADMVSSKMIDYYNRNRMDNAGHRMINTAEIVSISHGESIDHYNTLFENMGACAGATLYSTKMLQDIGIFDEYFITGYEDAELGVRATILGYKSVFEPSAIVYHKISTSINKIRNYNYTLSIQVAVWYTYFKLMPVGVILCNLPSLIFKYISILIIDIVFFRISFLKILFHSFYRVFFTQRQQIWQSRKQFFNKHQPIASLKILKKQTFFLWFDIYRFYHFVLLRKNPYA